MSITARREANDPKEPSRTQSFTIGLRLNGSRFRLGYLVLSLLLVSSPVFGQNTLRLGSAAAPRASGPEGSEVVLPITLTHDVLDGVGGFQFSLQHPPELTLIDLEYIGPFLASDVMVFTNVQDDLGFGSIAVLFGSFGPPDPPVVADPLPPTGGASPIIALARYSVPSDIDPGVYEIEFAPSGFPPIGADLATPMGSVVPTTENGRVVAVGPPPSSEILSRLWFPGGASDTVTVTDSSGSEQTSIVAPGLLENPVAVSVDSAGVSWVLYAGDSAIPGNDPSDGLARFTSSGMFIDEIDTGPDPVSVVIDVRGDAWIAHSDDTLAVVARDGALLYGPGGLLGEALGSGGEYGPNVVDLAADSIGNVWVVAQGDLATSGALRKLNRDGEVAVDLASTYAPGDLPSDVAVDRDGFVWITLEGAGRVERRTAGGVLRDSAASALASRIAIRRDVAGNQNEAWVIGDGNLVRRIRTGGFGEPATVDTFSVATATQLTGLSISTLGEVWVADSGQGIAVGLDPITGDPVGSNPLLSSGEFRGDISGYTQVDLFSQVCDDPSFTIACDLDGDGFDNSSELEAGSDPYDAASFVPAFVPPVLELTCLSADSDTVTLSWTLPDGIIYDSITVTREAGTTFGVAGDAESFVDGVIPEGEYTYTVFGTIGGVDSEVVSCVVFSGPGALLSVADVTVAQTATTLFGLTAVPDAALGQAAFYTTDAGNGQIYGLSQNLQLLTVIPSPFGPDRVTAGIAYNPIEETLFVLSGDEGPVLVAEIPLTGPDNDPVVFPVEFPGGAPLMGPLGGMALGLDESTGKYSLVASDPNICEIWTIAVEIDRTMGLVLEDVSSFGDDMCGFGSGVALPPTTQESGGSLPGFGIGGGTVFVTTLEDGAPIVEELVVIPGAGSGVGFATGVFIPLGAAGFQTDTGGFEFDGSQLTIVGLSTSEVLGIFTGLVLFTRGDVNGDGNVDIADSQAILTYLFDPLGLPDQECLSPLDTNGDAQVNLTDALYLLFHLFGGGAPPPAPFPDAGFQEAGCT